VPGVLLLAGIAGCAGPRPLRLDEMSRGCILLLPGVENTSHSMKGICDGLRDAGVTQAIHVDQWGEMPFGTFRNLPAIERNRERAGVRARWLAQYVQDFPDRPVTIIGYSGGGAMALFIAEALPESCRVDRIILLGAALSPTYDVHNALVQSRGGVVSFFSPRDTFMMGWGTRTFGTMDRVKTNSAGLVGFQNGSGELSGADGLTQVSWTPAWRRLGHDGGHDGWLARAWVREVLAPLIPAGPLDHSQADGAERASP
jgi:pimeloyl-ACP methyl ester carboxylesterase